MSKENEARNRTCGFYSGKKSCEVCNTVYLGKHKLCNRCGNGFNPGCFLTSTCGVCWYNGRHNVYGEGNAYSDQSTHLYGTVVDLPFVRRRKVKMRIGRKPATIFDGLEIEVKGAEFDLKLLRRDEC